MKINKNSVYTYLKVWHSDGIGLRLRLQKYMKYT
jgi:hypothetical protein